MNKLCKRSIAVLLCMIMMCSGFTMTAYGQTEGSAWDGSAKEEPSLEGDVYQIKTGAQLAWFADYVNAGNGSAKAELTQDIDLGAKEWMPIGNASKRFSGSFDGNGHAIHNLLIDSDTNYIGLFGYLAAGAVVTDIYLDGSISSSFETNGGYAGGVAGYASASTSKPATITKVRNACGINVKGSSYGSYAGGIVGFCGTAVTIKQCSNSGDIVGTQKAVGGIAGQGKAVSECYNTGNITGNTCVGGIVGLGSAEEIKDCYNTGNITGSSFVGGITAQASATAIPVKNCYNTGNIETIGTIAYSEGIAASSSAQVQNSYTSKVEKATDYGHAKVVTEQELRSLADELGEAYAVNIFDTYHAGTPVLTWELDEPEWKNTGSAQITEVRVAGAACTQAEVAFGTQMTEKMFDVVGFAREVELHTQAGYVIVPASWKGDSYQAEKAGTYVFTPVYNMPDGASLAEDAVIEKSTVTVREKGAAAPVVSAASLLEGTSSSITIKYGREELGLTNHIRATVDGEEKEVYVEWELPESFSATVPGVYTATAKFVEKYQVESSVEMPQIELTVKEQGFLGSLSFSSVSKSGYYEMEPAFDETVKEYTVYVPDTKSAFYVDTVLDESIQDGQVMAEYTNTRNAAQNVAVTSGMPKNLSQFVAMGSKTQAANNNTLNVNVTNTKDHSVQTYTIHVKRIRSLASLEASADGTKVNFLPAFQGSVFAYEMIVPDSQKEVTLSPGAQAKDSILAVTSDAAQGEIQVQEDGSYVIGLAEEGKTKAAVRVADESGGGVQTYYMTIKKTKTAKVSFETVPGEASVLVKDAYNERVLENEDGTFHLLQGETYTYTVSRYEYITEHSQFTAQDGTRSITLKKAAENPEINKEILAQWGSFGKNAQKNAVVSERTPTTASDAALYWTKCLGSGYGGQATGAPLIVDGYVISTVGSTIYKLDRFTGEIAAQGTMCGASNFSIVPPTYADGMIFVGLANGTIQAFNAETLESLWVYHDVLKGQPNSPITYHNGYVYTGFWNSEVKEANFVCVPVTDEDITKPDEEKHAAWTYTQKGGFYWAGAYVCDDYVLVGTDDGESGNTSQTSSILSLEPLTGKVIDKISGLNGDIRSTVCHDEVTGRYYVTSKAGSFYGFGVEADGTFTKEKDSSTGYDIKEIRLGGMSTSTPVVYNGRAYVGVSGTSQFGAGSGHCIAVLDLASNSIAYKAATKGYPQTSGLLSTAYEKETGYVYVYFLDNYTPGWVRYVKDKPGVTDAIDPYVEVTEKGTAKYAPILFTPSGAQAQYAVCTPIADEYGTLYFKNDSAYLMAVGSSIERIEVVKQPEKLQYAPGEKFDPAGMQVVAHLQNGMQRDVTKDIIIISGEALRADQTEITMLYDRVLYHDTDETVSGVSVHASNVKLQPLETYIKIKVWEEVKASAEPSKSAVPDESAKPSESEKPVGSTKPGESEKPVGSTKPAESGKPGESTKPEESGKPVGSTKPVGSEKPVGSTKPDGSEKPVGSTKPAGSTKPSESENVKPGENVKPNQSIKPGESTNPLQSVKPSEAVKPVPQEIPVEKNEDGTIQVQGETIFIKALEKVLETAENIRLVMTSLTKENSTKEYEKVQEVLKAYEPSHIMVCDMQFVNEKNEEIKLQGKVSISFTIQEEFHPERVAVVRIHQGIRTAQDADPYTLYQTVISEDKKTATIETDAMGTFVLMETDKKITVPGDVDGDGKITLKDAQMALKAALNLLVLEGDQKKAADVNQDGKIELKDAQVILKKALNLIP